MRAIQILLISFLSFPAFGQTYITNVTLVDVEKQKLVPAQTVILSRDKIIDIGPSKKLTPPAGATLINGSNKFLMPGLTDAHVHFFQSGGLYTRPDAIDLRKYRPYDKEVEWAHHNMEDLLRRYLKAGITTVIDVGATLNFLQQRDTFRDKAYAPSIYMTGPLITTWEPEVYKKLGNDEPFFEVKTAEEAREMVRKQLLYKPDFIKIWYILGRGKAEELARKHLPLVKATIEEAHKHGLRVAVHATERITAQLAVESGADFLVHFIEDEIVNDDFLQLLKSKKTVLSPTLVVNGGYGKTFAQRNAFDYRDLTTSNPVQLGSVYDLLHLSDTGMINMYKRYMQNQDDRMRDSIVMTNIKKMSDAGIILATGTDAGNIGTQHASSFFHELDAMKKSGMNNWQIIQASTINGAKALGKEKEFGSIAKGKRADMILLNANPIDELKNLQQPAIVISKGHVILPDTLIKETALALVQRQLNAYNARNIDAFLEPYADDVELYEYPSKLFGKGKENMRKMYTDMFKEVTSLHCEIKNRIVQGNVIIDHERVTGFGSNVIEAVAIYHIENNKIKRVEFIR